MPLATATGARGSASATDRSHLSRHPRRDGRCRHVPADTACQPSQLFFLASEHRARLRLQEASRCFAPLRPNRQFVRRRLLKKHSLTELLLLAHHFDQSAGAHHRNRSSGSNPDLCHAILPYTLAPIPFHLMLATAQMARSLPVCLTRMGCALPEHFLPSVELAARTLPGT